LIEFNFTAETFIFIVIAISTKQHQVILVKANL